MYDSAYFELEAPVASTPPLELRARSAPVQSFCKRTLDILAAATLLLLITPAFIIVAICIRAESKGPILFRQRRGGLLGKPFMVYKFRSMNVTEDGDQIGQASRKDPRVTRVGAFLRRTSIDELPQLLNVLKGEMSLVGPRPHAVAHDREFQQRVPTYTRRFAMKPGITGLAQVRGFRGETREAGALEARIACDLEYIETWSLWQDIKLLLATLKVPLDSRAY